MITEEQQEHMEPEMNSDQGVLKEQGLGHDEPQAQDHQPSGSLAPPEAPPLDDEHSAMSTSGADEREEREEGEIFGEESALESVPQLHDQQQISRAVSSLESALELHDRQQILGEESGSALENVPELHDQRHSVEDDKVEVVADVSPMKEEQGPLHSPKVVSWQVDGAAGGTLNVENSIVSPVGLPNAPPSHDEVLSPTLTSPGRRRSKGGRQWKKNGGKKKAEREAAELPSPAALHNSRDAGTQTDEQELQRNGLETAPAAQPASKAAVDQHRVVTEAQEPGSKSTTAEQEDEQVHGDSVQHQCESTSARPECEEGEIAEDPKVQTPSLKAFRSFGRWADVSEDVDTRATTDTDPDRITNPTISVDNQSSDSQQQGQELRAIPEQGFEGPHGRESQDIRTQLKVNPTENGLRGKTQLGVAISPREGIRSPKGSPRGKSHQSSESFRSLRSPRSRHDLRADSWSNHKEQDLRGKTQLGSRDSLSQASREPNWRRGPEEPRARQDMPRRSSKLGLDGDTKKDEQQDFRSRSQYGAEPQATHKNWIPRRGLGGHRVDGEGRTEQSKSRGKGKQGGHDSEPQNQYTNDSAARQKFEADLRIKKDELLQRSKLSLKAEFQKAKRIEQVRKGGDHLEMELDKNLVYEDGELFYLNT